MKTMNFIAIAICICLLAIPMMVMAEDPVGEVTPELTEAPIIKETPVETVTPELTEAPVTTQELISSMPMAIPSELKLSSQTTDRKLFTITLSNFGEKVVYFNDLKSKYAATQKEAKLQDPEKSIIGKIIDVVNPDTLSQNEEVTLDVTVDGSSKDLYFDDYWLLIRNN